MNLTLIGDNVLSAGLQGRWRSGRDNDGDLEGFDKVKWAVEGGAFARWRPIEWLRLRGEVRHGFGGHSSWGANAGADVFRREGPWVMSVGARVRWADSDFTRTFFQVTPAEAERSLLGVQPYAPHGDFLSAGGLVAVEYRWNRRWSFSADAEYHRLMADAADSPIVADLGSADQFRVTVGVRHTFGQ